MNKTNLLQKLSPLGVAAFGAITATVGSMLFAPLAQAVTFSASDFFEGEDITIGDKLFEAGDFDFGVRGISEDDLIEVVQVGNDYDFAYVFDPDIEGDFPGDTSSFTFDYTVTILDNDKFFQAVDIDSEVNAFTDTLESFTAEYETDDDFQTLTSLNGNSDEIAFAGVAASEGGDNTMEVFNTLTLDSTGNGTVEGVFFSVENSFQQGEVGDTIPEPATILGLLTFGALSLGLKSKKQL